MALISVRFVYFCMSVMSVACSQHPISTRKYFHLGMGERISTSSATIAKYDNIRRIHCTLKCVQTMSCQSFFFNKFTKICEIKNKTKDEIGTGTKVTGQQYYYDSEGTIRVSQEKNTRLLFVEYHVSKFRTLSLYNHSISIYPYIHFRLSVTTAVAYIPSMKRILVGINKHRGQILSYPLYNKRPDILKQRMDCNALAADGNLVFLFVKPRTRTGNVLSRMTASGGSYREIYNVGNFYIKGLVAVSTDKLVYFCFSHKIMSISYDGKDKKVIFSRIGTYFSGLGFDKLRNVLYLTVKKTVVVFSLTSKTSTVAVSLPKASDLENIVYYENEIFFLTSYCCKCEIWIHNVVNNRTERVVSDKRKMTYCTIS